MDADTRYIEEFWLPIIDLICGDVSAYMFLQAVDSDASILPIYVYKHRDTRRCINVTADGACFKFNGSTGSYTPISQADAIRWATS